MTQDLRRDWKRWSRAERLIAIATMLMAAAIPAVVLLGAAPI